MDLTQLREGKLSFSSGNSLVKMDVLFPSYINKSMYQLQYRLKSENDSLWTDIEDHQRLILNQISPGAYKLECRAFNKLIPEDQVYALTRCSVIKSILPKMVVYYVLSIDIIFDFIFNI